MQTLRILVAFVFVLALACAARASVLYNNLSATSNRSDQIGSNFGPLSDSFSTGASAYDLNTVIVLLSSGPGTGTITASLLSDSSTSPGTLLDTIGTLSESSVSSGSADYTFTLATTYPLAANTRYWIQLSDTDNTVRWEWSLDTSGPGVANEFFANQSGVFSNPLNGPYQMEVEATPAAVVPEPGSLLLLAVVGLAWLTQAAIRRNRCVH